MATTKSALSTAVSTAASLVASAMLLRSIAKDLLPNEFKRHIFSSFYSLLYSRFSSQFTITIDEFDGFAANQIYAAAEIYLGTISCPSTKRLRVSKPETDKNISMTMDKNEEIIDIYEGIKLKWLLTYRETEHRTFHSRDFGSTIRSHVRYFTLSFHKKHKDKVLNSYLPHLLSQYKSMREAQKGVKLYTMRYDDMYSNRGVAWSSVNLDHPSTFKTLAMDPEMKKDLMADLDRFIERKDYYRKVGKAWKRGYLLYGPPGTGKSSLIAAMANYLNFNLYDLELTDLRCNSDLRKLLVATANRSILVVEDIDCSIDLNTDRGEDEPIVYRNGRRVKQEKQVTLSGLLNFIDGLWSSCGDERIIIFTTNHKEKLDPALLRPGRMDMHIHMSYCKFSGFKVLAENYLEIQDHHLFLEIESMMQEVDVTPAEVAEELMKTDDSDAALKGLVDFLHGKMEAKQVSEGENQGEERVEDGENIKVVKKDQDEKHEGKSVVII